MISTRRREFAIFNPLLFVSDPLHITTQHHTTQYLTTQHHKRNITQRNIISHIITHNIISHITTQSTTSHPTTQQHNITLQQHNAWQLHLDTEPSKWLSISLKIESSERIVFGWLDICSFQLTKLKLFSLWAVVVVKWSVCSLSTPTIRVRILLTPTVFPEKLCLKRTTTNKIRGRGDPFTKNFQHFVQDYGVATSGRSYKIL